MDFNRIVRKRVVDHEDEVPKKIRRVQSSDDNSINAEEKNKKTDDNEKEPALHTTPPWVIVSPKGHSSGSTKSHSQAKSAKIQLPPRNLQERLIWAAAQQTPRSTPSENDQGISDLPTNSSTNESPNKSSQKKSNLQERLERVQRGEPSIDLATALSDVPHTATATASNPFAVFNRRPGAFRSTPRPRSNLLDVPDPCTLDKDTFYIILDTNIFIHHFKIINGFTKASVQDGKKSVIYVPWIVLQELDNLKRRRGRNDIQSDVIRAINFIESQLRVGVIKGQKGNDNNHLIDINTPDDYIIDCCLKVKNFTTSMILVSNDTNLRAKSILHNIRTVGPLQMLQLVYEKIKKED